MDIQHTRGEPWFDDGNVFLLAEGVAFRVHRGVVARASEVMQHMFALPQAEDADPGAATIDGCAIVPMYDDPALLALLIKALYDGPTIPERNASEMFDLFGILILATKYMITRLRAQILRHLCTIWPQTLPAHDAMVARALSGAAVDGLSYPYVHPLHVLPLARAVHARALAPAALYFLSMYPLADLLRGDHPKLATAHAVVAPTPVLERPDVLDYTLMYQHRIDTLLDFTRHLPEAAAPECERAVQCARALRALQARLARSWNIRTSPLYLMKQAVESINDDQMVCRACKRVFGEHVEEVRERTWQALPGVVGLPSWSDLIAELED